MPSSIPNQKSRLRVTTSYPILTYISRLCRSQLARIWCRCSSSTCVLQATHASRELLGKGHKDGLDVCLAFRGILALVLIVLFSLTTSLALCSGNFLIIASSTSCAIALTWGGIRFPWSSANILVPLILGLVGIIAFLVYEATLAKHPIVSSLTLHLP